MADPAPEDDTFVASMGFLVQDSNGSGTYSNERAMMGHIEASLFMLIPKTIETMARNAPALAVDVKAFGSTYGIKSYLGASSVEYREKNKYFNFYPDGTSSSTKALDALKMSILNYSALKNAGYDSLRAYYIAGLRTRWAMTGGMSAMFEKEDTLTKEYVVVDEADSTYGALLKAKTIKAIVALKTTLTEDYLAAHKATTGANEWIVKHSEALWAATEYVFRARGHHYKSDDKSESGYDAVYDRYMRASFEGNFVWPNGLSRADVYHTAIHPFKIRALPIVTAHYLAYGKLSEAAKVRLIGSPCGHAVITTAVAALKTMKGEIWWSSFNKAFEADIKKINAYADQINDNKYGYHQGAGLYGVEKADAFVDIVTGERVEINTAKSDVKFIAAACQGLIQALTLAKESRNITVFALSNAKALEKAAADAPLLTMRVRILITSSLEMASDAKDITTLVNVLLPDLKDKIIELKT